MKCPCCGYEETKVTDSRNQHESNSVRRRRECLECGKRFTTFESVDLTIQVKKRDGSFQEFSLEKLVKGLDSACRHTKISHDQVVAIASDVTMDIMGSGVREIDTLRIGEIVMKKLCKLDPIAYVRFACVYRRFQDMEQLKKALMDVAL
ncbi:MAG: Transcriptional repressor NrdR [Chlamydiia bacterium]|nr:Transcriptional repressor NrdR [Chlamydiia bacterium]